MSRKANKRARRQASAPVHTVISAVAETRLSGYDADPSSQRVWGRDPFNKLETLPRTEWLAGVLLCVMVILAYYPALHARYIWDDDVYITNNQLLTAPDGLWRIWFSFDSPSQYFPLVYTTFRIEHALWGLNPAGYHWVNILLHIANALLVWRL